MYGIRKTVFYKKLRIMLSFLKLNYVFVIRDSFLIWLLLLNFEGKFKVRCTCQ